MHQYRSRLWQYISSLLTIHASCISLRTPGSFIVPILLKLESLPDGGKPMLNQRFCTLAALCCVLILSTSAPALAQDDVDEGGERCIDTRRISSTQIIDKQNILFHMRDRTIYHNELPRSCPGLRRGKTISYRTSISRLCSIDSITILESFGMGMSRGASCGLGKFRPISKEEAQALRGGDETEIEPKPMPPAEPEEPEVSK